MIKLVFISHLYPRNEADTETTRALHNIVKHWNDKVNITIIRPLYYNPFKKLHVKAFTHTLMDGVKIYHIPVMHVSLAGKYYCFMMLICYFLISRRIKPSIVVSHAGPDYIWARFIARFFKAKFVIGLHGSDVRGALRNRQSSFRSADLIACRSPEIAKKFITIFPQYKAKCTLAPSGIEREEIEPSLFWMKKSDNWETRTRFITVSKLIPLKNIDTIISALSELRHFNWEYDVIGEGPERQSLEQSVVKLELSDRIRFLGYKPRSEILHVLCDYHVFLMPSAPETFGLAYLEAMAKGCIPICAKNWGIDGIIQDGVSGYTVPARDVKNLKKLLEMILGMSKKAKRDTLMNVYGLITEYTEDFVAQKYLDDILNLL